MTRPEVLLWSRLRRRQTGYLFRRQRPLGPYVADFYCCELLLVVEVDGRNHDRRGLADRRRDAWLSSAGIMTRRVPASDVLQDPDEAARMVERVCRQRAAQLTESRGVSID